MPINLKGRISLSLILICSLVLVVFIVLLVSPGERPLTCSIFDEASFSARGASTLETDFQLSNKTLSSSTIRPGEGVLFNFTITNTGEREERYRIMFLQDYNWGVEITGIFDENGTSLNFTRHANRADLLNGTSPGDKIYFWARLGAPAFTNDFNFTKRKMIEELGIYAHKDVTLTVRVMASSDNYATKKDMQFKVRVKEYHSLVCVSEEPLGYISRTTLQKSYSLWVTHVSNLFESTKTAPIRASFTRDENPAAWNVSLSDDRFILERGKTQELVLYISATKESLVLDDPYFFEVGVNCREELNNNAFLVSFRTMVQQEGKFEFVFNESECLKSCRPGTSVDFHFGVRNTGKGLDSVYLYTVSNLPFWEDISTRASVLKPGEVEYRFFSVNLPEISSLRAGDLVEIFLIGHSVATPEFAESLRFVIEVDMFFGFYFEGEYRGFITSENAAYYELQLTSEANVIQNISFSILPDISYSEDGTVINTTLGATDWYAAVTPKNILLNPGETGAVNVTMGTLHSGSPDDYAQIKVQGTVEGIPPGNPFYPYQRTVNITTTISPYHSITVKFPSNRTTVPSSSDVDVAFTLKNTGNIEEVVTFSGACDWSFYIPSKAMRLDPHEEKEINVTVYTPQEMYGNSVPLTVTAQISEYDFSASDTTRLVIGTSYGASLQVLDEYSLLEGVPGARLAFVLNLTNIGNDDDVFRLVSPSGYVNLESSLVELDAFQSIAVPGTVTVPDSPDSGLVFGKIYTINIVATSQQDPKKNATAPLTIYPHIIGVKPSGFDENYYTYKLTPGSGRTIAEVEGYCLRNNKIIYSFEVVNILTTPAELSFEIAPETYTGVSVQLDGAGIPTEKDPILGTYLVLFGAFEKKSVQLIVDIDDAAVGKSYLFNLKVEYTEGYEIVQITTQIPDFDLKIVDLKLKTESFEGKKTKAKLSIMASGTTTGVLELDRVYDVSIRLIVEDGERFVFYIGTMMKGQTKTIEVYWDTPEMHWLIKKEKYDVTVNIWSFSSYQTTGYDDNPDNNHKKFTFTAQDSSVVALFPFSYYSNVYIIFTFLSFLVITLLALRLTKTYQKRIVRYPFYPLYLTIFAIVLGLVYSLPVDGVTYTILMVFFSYLILFACAFIFSFRGRHHATSCMNGILPYAVFIFVITAGASLSQFLSVFFLEIFFYIHVPFFAGQVLDIPIPNLLIIAMSVAFNYLAFILASKLHKNALHHISIMQYQLELLKGEGENHVL